MKSIALVVALLAVVLIIGGTIYLKWMRSQQNLTMDRTFDSKPKRPAMSRAEDAISGERLALVPSSASAARAQRTGLPTSGSEDVSRLLIAPRRQTDNRHTVEEHDYRPDEAIDWVIDVEFEGDPILEVAAIRKQFNDNWIKSHGHPTIYGWSLETKHWTYLVSSNAPKSFSKLAIAWSLYDPGSEDSLPVASTDLERWRSSAEDLTKQLGNPRIRTNRSAQNAAHLSIRIHDVVRTSNREVTVFLAAPPGKQFEGRDVWDVMLCLGLRWGDMDLFHWRNESSIGDDYYFSVGTSTPPCYFLPEQIADNQIHVKDLVFSFSIPRSADPEAVFGSMLKAVEYSQRRLGGELRDAKGLPLAPERFRREIRAVVDQMDASGFSPGENSTLRVF
jgi:cell division protein ZipA